MSQTLQIPGSDKQLSEHIERIRKNYRRSWISTEIFPVEKSKLIVELEEIELGNVIW